MATVRLDTRLIYNSQILLLSDRAFRLYISAVCWTAEYSTAGVIPHQMLRFFVRRGSRAAAAELIEAVLWADADNGDYQILPGPFAIDRAPKYGDGQRERIYERDGHKCVICDTTEDLTLDHIHPRALAGDDSDDNLRTLCRPCNSRKGARV